MNVYLKALDDAAARGHRLESDPSVALTSVARHTCCDCGRAVLCGNGLAWGSALEVDCVVGIEATASERSRRLTDHERSVWAATFGAKFALCHKGGEASELADVAVLQLRRLPGEPGRVLRLESPEDPVARQYWRKG